MHGRESHFRKNTSLSTSRKRRSPSGISAFRTWKVRVTWLDVGCCEWALCGWIGQFGYKAQGVNVARENDWRRQGDLEGTFPTCLFLLLFARRMNSERPSTS